MQRLSDEQLEELGRSAVSDEIKSVVVELQRYRSTVLRWHNAERKWDLIKWEDVGDAKHEYASRLADALGQMHKLAWDE